MQNPTDLNSADLNTEKHLVNMAVEGRAASQIVWHLDLKAGQRLQQVYGLCSSSDGM